MANEEEHADPTEIELLLAQGDECGHKACQRPPGHTMKFIQCHNCKKYYHRQFEPELNNEASECTECIDENMSRRMQQNQ